MLQEVDFLRTFRFLKLPSLGTSTFDGIDHIGTLIFGLNGFWSEFALSLIQDISAFRLVKTPAHLSCMAQLLSDPTLTCES